jgi:hypothetical protein
MTGPPSQKSARNWGGMTPAWLALPFAVLTLLAATWSRWSHHTSYDPTVALLGLQTLALAWYTAVTQRALHATQAIAEEVRTRERDAASRSATALLVELGIISGYVSASGGVPGRDVDRLVHPILSNLLASLPAYPPATIERMVVASRAIDALAAVQADLLTHRDAIVKADLASHAQDQRAGGGAETLAAYARTRAIESESLVGMECQRRAKWAWDAILRLSRDLRDQGGKIPDEPPPLWGLRDPLPPNEPDIFPRARG